MENFLIIRLSSLGDIIHTLPAFSALRKNFPREKISWAVEEKGKEILDLVPGVDSIITVRPAGWRINKKEFWSEIRRLKKELSPHSDTAVDFQGLVKSGFMAFLSPASKRIGFHRKNLREPLASIFYTERLPEIAETIHVINKNLKLLNLVGVQEEKYEFPLRLPEELLQFMDSRLKGIAYDTQKKLVVFNIGAGWQTKRWFPERWISLIESLKRKDTFGLLLWGTEEEKSMALDISKKTHIPLAPFLRLKEIMALLKKASLLISGDTFALQAACALNRPVVGLFGPTNPQRNGPFRPEDKVAFHELECSYCYKRTCSSLECLKKITPQEVASLSLQVLERNG
ncbi:MAG: lipopolysaccharide heptosyltransferase I [Candidatus Aminicenantes bacterium]